MWLSIVASRVDTAWAAELASEGAWLPALPELAGGGGILLMGPWEGGDGTPVHV